MKCAANTFILSPNYYLLTDLICNSAPGERAPPEPLAVHVVRATTTVISGKLVAVVIAAVINAAVFCASIVNDFFDSIIVESP